MATNSIGWLSAIVLLATIGRQVYTQWRDGSSQGVSRWLFIGQITASIGFVIYSVLLKDWVFIVTKERADAGHGAARAVDFLAQPPWRRPPTPRAPG